ncbi:MAG: transcriptional regulator [Candidatus Odinarchaeota archaeon]
MMLSADELRKSLIEPSFTVSWKDKNVSEPVRFIIMLVLYLNGEMDFTSLQQLLGLTPGNLDHHVKTLIKAGYVTKKKLISYRILTIIMITSKGKETFTSYASGLKDLLDRVNFNASFLNIW